MFLYSVMMTQAVTNTACDSIWKLFTNNNISFLFKKKVFMENTGIVMSVEQFASNHDLEMLVALFFEIANSVDAH